jgi:hypothetical protein
VTHRDTILAFLASAGGPVCDDCLSARTGITPRQTVNLNCRRLEKMNQIARSQIMGCHYCRSEKICSVLSRGAVVPPKPPMPVAKTDDPHKLWHWEGNVQNRLVTWLEQEGWTIRSAADTAAKSSGKDIIAERDGRTLWVSVKGYPRGTRKTNPSTQARHWFSHAVFDLVRYRDESDTAELALGLPAGYATYQNLADRITWLRSNLPITIYWVSESGAVRSQ